MVNVVLLSDLNYPLSWSMEYCKNVKGKSKGEIKGKNQGEWGNSREKSRGTWGNSREIDMEKSRGIDC